jgi:hypothetical protein
MGNCGRLSAWDNHTDNTGEIRRATNFADVGANAAQSSHVFSHVALKGEYAN